MKNWTSSSKSLPKSLIPRTNPPIGKICAAASTRADGITPGGGWQKKTLPWLALGLLLLIGGLAVYYGIDTNEGIAESKVGSTRPAIPSSAQVPQAKHEETPSPAAENGTLEVPAREQKTIGNSSSDLPQLSQAGESRTASEPNDSEDLKELPRNLASVSGVREQSNQSEQERGEGAILLPKTTPNAKLEISTDPNGRRNHVGPSATFGREEAARQVPSQERLQSMPGQEESNPAGESQTESASRERWLRVAPLDSRKNYQESGGLTYPRVAFTSPPDSLSGQNAAETPAIQIPKWSIRLGISPDLSVVRMSDMMHPMQPGPSASAAGGAQHQQ